MKTDQHIQSKSQRYENVPSSGCCFSEVSTTGGFCCLKKAHSGPLGRGRAPGDPAGPGAGARRVKAVMAEESARAWEASGGAGGRRRACGPPGVMLRFSPQGRAEEPSAPLQTSTHAWWSKDEGFGPHDPVPGVLGGSQALRTPAPQRQHDYGERQDQHHGTPSAPSIGSLPKTEGVSCQNHSGL